MGDRPRAPSCLRRGLAPLPRRARRQRAPQPDRTPGSAAAARTRALSLLLSLAAALALTCASRAWAGPFPIEEPFTSSTAGSHWVLGGSAVLTAAREAEGWLRLTPAEAGKFGFAYDNEAFPSTAGALVEFEYADWGGSGADGLTFFLFNGATSEAEFHPGQPGGSLGYAPCNNPNNGLTNAYVGVGFDEYGNFTNLKPICGLDGEAFDPNHVSVRGSEGEAYKLLTTTSTAESLRAERAQARRVTIAITPTRKLSVYIRFPDGTYQRVTQNFQLPAAPATLKFGYVASTGALNDDHEIRQARVVKPTQLTPTVSQTGGGNRRGEALTWTAIVHNEGPNATQKASVRTSTGEQPLTSVSWTCVGSGGAACATSSGTGLPDLDAGAMPEGSSLTYKITGTASAEANYAQMTVEAEPAGEAGELDPERDRATATTDLTPLFDKAPSFTLAASGLATATPGSALGGGVTYGYQWQRCEANGSSCANIAGAQASTYHTTSADREHTIRFTQTATNTAGSAAADAAAFEPLPAATITAQPSSYVVTTEASLAFSSATNGAGFECSLDGGAWSACSSPQSYSKLSAGTHTFDVRAIYGGLSSPTHSSATWTVEPNPPHAPTILSAPALHSTQGNSTFKFGGLEKNDALECRLDQGAWTPCGATSEFAALAVGVHHVEVRQVDRAGVASTATAFTWTIEAKAPPAPAKTPPAQTNAPPAPAAASAPEAETTQTTAHFTFSHEPGATVECSLDGKPYVNCTSGISVSGLAAGWHTLTVRQARSSGAVSPVITYRWHVRRKAASKCQAKSKSKAKRAHKADAKTKKTKAVVCKVAAKPKRTGAKRVVEAKPNTIKSKTKTNKVKTEPKVNGAQPTLDTNTAKPKVTTKPVKAKPNAKARPKIDTKPEAQPTKATTEPRSKLPPTSKAGHTPSAIPQSAAEPQADTNPRAQPEASNSSKPKTKPTPKHTPAPAASSPTPAKTTPSPAATHGPRTTPRPKRQKNPKPKPTIAPEPSAAPAPAPSSEAQAKPSVRLLITPFAADSWVLVAQARRRVHAAASKIADARTVTCVGYTDNSGSSHSNLEIGLRRARAVCAALRALGVHASFEVQTAGASRPLASNTTAAGRSANRRVEVSAVY
jgi:outer membrane protein OmpA-like peptidoglycan-associated protein